VITLGVKPNFDDYAREDQERIRQAPRIYYPSAFYADLLDAVGKPTFPSYHTYKSAQDKIRQSALFKWLGLPHPETRVYYGRRWQEKIPRDFRFPLIAKIPRGSALGRGVFLIHDQGQLEQYHQLSDIAYIQCYMPAARDLRVVIIGGRAVHAYWRVGPPGEFRNNLSRGGRIELGNIPQAAVDLALAAARQCGWDDVGLDILPHEGRYYLLEANMNYGREGFRAAGIDYHQLLEAMIDQGKI
jgi:ribosomal protein S6--L-glutamate ligase